MTWRRFGVLLRNLPDSSLYHEKLGGWPAERQVSVATIEALDVLASQLHYLRSQVAQLGGSRRRPSKWKALRVPRPWDEPEPEPERMSIAQFRTMNEGGD